MLVIFLKLFCYILLEIPLFRYRTDFLLVQIQSPLRKLLLRITHFAKTFAENKICICHWICGADHIMGEI